MQRLISMMLLVFLMLLLFSTKAVAATRYGEVLCQSQGYTCYKVLKGETWQTLFPDDNTRAVVMRINRMNVPLHGGMTIAVPENTQNMDYMSFAPFDRFMPGIGKKLIVVDLAHLAWGAYDADGNLVQWGPAAGGKSWCPDTGSSCHTVVGTFSVYNKGGERCKSSKYPLPDGGAPMPYCMFFKGGYAIHASNDVPGYHASHGCVRVLYEDAQWLNKSFAEPGTTVIVRPYVSVEDKMF